jgi:hypothetical protein
MCRLLELDVTQTELPEHIRLDANILARMPPPNFVEWFGDEMEFWAGSARGPQSRFPIKIVLLEGATQPPIRATFSQSELVRAKAFQEVSPPVFHRLTPAPLCPSNLRKDPPGSKLPRQA